MVASWELRRDMSDMIILAIVGGCLAAVVAIMIIIGNVISKKAKAVDNVYNVVVKDGVRYTTDKAITTEHGDVKVTHRMGDIQLNRGVTYTVAKGDNIIPGKYAVLSIDNNVDKFNMRIGGFVRELVHGSNIVLSEGDEIAAVSHDVALR